MPLKIKKGSEPPSVGSFRLRLAQPSKQAKQACRVMDELPLADVETPSRAVRDPSPLDCSGIDLSKGDLRLVESEMPDDDNE